VDLILCLSPDIAITY